MIEELMEMNQGLLQCMGVSHASIEKIPSPGKGSLYVRPLLLGSGPVLGLTPTSEYMFLVYAAPVRNYFKVSDALRKLGFALYLSIFIVGLLVSAIDHENRDRGESAFSNNLNQAHLD